ncbi:hypothetical protein Peur_071958 [Populus x canadensis]
MTGTGGDGMVNGALHTSSAVIHKPIVRITVLFLGVLAVSCIVLYKSAYHFEFLPGSSDSDSLSMLDNRTSKGKFDLELEGILKNASTKHKTVILTTLNQAWAEPGSIFDLFLESFQVGDNTQKLVKNLIIISMDQKAHARCLAIHPHCYALRTEGLNFSSEAYFMSEEYLKMMWRRIEFLGTVLEMGYSFVFTDADIVWLRNPFPRFYPKVDFQIACDNYYGNPEDKNNRPNGGFTYVRSNLRTIQFYRFWFQSRETYPGNHDQDVLNMIKNDPFLEKIRLEMRFLDTAYFGGFCERSKDFHEVCTMHANCCYGLGTKVHDLKIVLEDWKNFMSLPLKEKASASPAWRAPQNCRT